MAKTKISVFVFVAEIGCYVLAKKHVFPIRIANFCLENSEDTLLAIAMIRSLILVVCLFLWNKVILLGRV